MHNYIEYLRKNLKIPLLSVTTIIALTHWVSVGGLFKITHLLVSMTLDPTWLLIVSTQPTQLTPTFISSVFIALFYSSPLWIFAIWKITIPKSRIGLLSALLGLLFILLSILFVLYIFIPFLLSSINSVSSNKNYIDILQYRDGLVKMTVSFILLFQIFPITLHFRKNYSRSFIHSVLIRVLLLVITALITPTGFAFKVIFIATAIVVFELSRAMRRYVVIEHGQLDRSMTSNKTMKNAQQKDVVLDS